MRRDDLSRFSLGVGKGRMVRIWYNLCMIAANSLGKPGPASWDLVGHGQIFHIKTSINCLLGQLVRSSLPILLIYYPWIKHITLGNGNYQVENIFSVCSTCRWLSYKAVLGGWYLDPFLIWHTSYFANCCWLLVGSSLQLWTHLDLFSRKLFIL